MKIPSGPPYFISSRHPEALRPASQVLWRLSYCELVMGWNSLLEHSSRLALLQARVSGLILEPGACV